MPAKRGAHIGPSPAAVPRRRRHRRGRRRARRRLARARSAGCASSCSSAASSARRRRASPPACSRPSPRPTSASARCSTSGCARRGAGPRSPPSCTGCGHRRRPRACGTLFVARDRDEAEALERELALRERLGLAPSACCPRQARRLEPALAPTLRLALEVPDDHAADPRALVAALARAAAGAGAVLRTGAVERSSTRSPGDGRALAAASASRPRRRRRGRRVGGRARRPARGGARARAPGQGPDPAPARPRTAPACSTRVVRFEGGYLVPRGDGRYVLGATMEERGFDTTVTAGGVYELLRDAAELVPGVLELELEEVVAGLRPGDARQRAGARPRADARRARLGDRPPPQRRPARAAHRRARRRGWPASAPAHAFAPSASRGREARVICVNGEPTDGARRRRRSRDAARRARRRRRARAASRSRSTPRSSRAANGRRARVPDGARVEVVTAIQGG